MKKLKFKSIGIFGGSFDPPHHGHLKIALTFLKETKSSYLYWLITEKNPFKKKSFFSLKERIKRSKQITNKNKKIKVLYLEQKLKSLRTISSINYLKRKNLKAKIFLLIGSDNLIYFHKWHKYREILKKCEVLVFSRKGFDKKAKKSIIIKRYRGKNIIFIKNKKIDISSSTIRNKYKKI